MDHPEVLGSASASEVPAPPPGSGYNFRPRSRSATAPKNRRLGSVETQGVGSTLHLPTVTPPNSPTPSGAGNPTHDNETQALHGNAEINNPTIIPHDSTTEPSPPHSTLIPNTVAVGTSLPFSTYVQIFLSTPRIFPEGQIFTKNYHFWRFLVPYGHSFKATTLKFRTTVRSCRGAPSSRHNFVKIALREYTPLGENYTTN